MTFPPRRPLGRTGFVATRLGIGDLADRRIPIDTLVATARAAIDAGLNVIDTAPSYEEGYSEQVVGRAVRGLRDRMFVIDKIDHHDDPVTEQVDESLQRLGLEHVDLMVFHGLSTMEGWRRAIAPGGGLDQLEAARRVGKVRFVGISSHSAEVLAAAASSGRVDVVMFAVGPYVDRRYIDEILPLCRARGVGTVCFKTFGAGKLLGDTSGYNQPLSDRPRGKLSSAGHDGAAPTLPCLSVDDCLHFTLSCDPDVALLGLSYPNEQAAAFASFARFRGPLPEAQMADIHRRARLAIAGKGPCWWGA